MLASVAQPGAEAQPAGRGLPLYRVGVLCAAVAVVITAIWATNRRAPETVTRTPADGTVSDPNAPGSFVNPYPMAADDLVAVCAQDREIAHARYYGRWISLTAAVEWAGIDQEAPHMVLKSTYSDSADRLREQWERSTEKPPALQPPEKGFGKIACRLLMPDKPVMSEDEQEVWHYRREASKLLEWYGTNLVPGRQVTVTGKFADRAWETGGQDPRNAFARLDDPIVVEPRQPMPKTYVQSGEPASGG